MVAYISIRSIILVGDRLMDRQIDWSIDWLTDWLIDWLIKCLRDQRLPRRHFATAYGDHQLYDSLLTSSCPAAWEKAEVIPILKEGGHEVAFNNRPLSLLAVASKGLFTWSGGPRSSGVGFFCFHALGDTKQKKLTPLDRGPPLHVNRV